MTDAPSSISIIEDLKKNLRTAIELEFATLPLYLTAMYSMTVQSYPAYDAVRTVLMEEMVHMGTACNLLAALGEAADLAACAPTYPSQGLPGHAEADLHVTLASLSKYQLWHFLRIETPRALLNQFSAWPEELGDDPRFAEVRDTLWTGEKIRGEAIANIDALYETIRAQFNALLDAPGSGDAPSPIMAAMQAAAGPDSKAHQAFEDIGVRSVVLDLNQSYADQLDSARRQIGAAIDVIEQQGEGAGELLAGPNFEYEKSHYVRFAEPFFGARFDGSKVEVDLDSIDSLDEPLRHQREWFCGDEVTLAPLVEQPPGSGHYVEQAPAKQMVPLPEDHYAELLTHHEAIDAAEAKRMREALDTLDNAYSLMVDTLAQWWSKSRADRFADVSASIIDMIELKVPIRYSIMTKPLPAELVEQLPTLYGGEWGWMRAHVDLDRDVYYGPRFAYVPADKRQEKYRYVDGSREREGQDEG